ncbi:MAG TPA: FtsX-like permease family protein [Solirubrobacteraceae bacterium]|nr:FtsX-like permease family protein [Solirubrobacteraceae bacterium]
MRPFALVYLYRSRLRVHAVQELLAGLGVAIAVALVFAVIVANGSIAGSATEVVHTVVGPASLQVRARNADGFDARLLTQIKRLAGVQHAAPLLEQTATIVGPSGRRVMVDLAGADISLVVLDGLARTLPIATLSPGGIGLSGATAKELGISTSSAGAAEVSVLVRGRANRLKVASVLGSEAAGALSQAQVALIPLARLQQLANLPGRVSRILVQTKPGREVSVRSKLQALSGGRLTVAPADQDVTLLHQALRPSDQASEIFAAISALLGFLFAFNAILLTVPERRQMIADLRLTGTKHSAIVQMVLFQALCLGIAASLVGLLGGYALSLGVFHQSTGYLAQAFTLGTSTVVGLRPLLLSLIGGIVATCLASLVPLLDLRTGRAEDAVYREGGVPGNALGARSQLRLGLAAVIMVVFTIAVLALQPSLVLIASAVLALATVLAVPLVFGGVLRAGEALSERNQKLTILPVALTSLKATTLRSLALAATGAVALFGSVALGGARSDLLRGIGGFARSYSADADIWVANPGDNQATVDFQPDRYAARIAQVPGVASVSAFQGSFLELGSRRVWIIARPPAANQEVLRSQVVDGDAITAVARLSAGGWIAISKQLAEERHVTVGGVLTLPTPTGNARFKVAATTTNLAWSPGVIFMNTADYGHFWATTMPTALGVKLLPGTSVSSVRQQIVRSLGPGNGLEVSAAHTREENIDALTSEGLGQLREISTLLIFAAILAMAAALMSAIWQRRASLAGLRLSGVRPHRLRRILLMESALMLSAGCLTGATAGFYGQVVIDAYLKQTTGFPIASITTSWRPLEIFALVIMAVLAMVAIPGWVASRVPARLALDD